ncbi:MAG: hypothetical protein HY717_05850, partial [Planctomycetes bacterium]|nr:hypothetical protein [Planctomycetota bacterium]
MHWAAALFFASAGVLSQASSTVERLTHSYDVRFLTETLPRFSLAGERPPAPRLALGDLDLLQLEERAGGGAGVEFSTAMVEESLVTPGLRVSPEMLVDLIRRNIAPDSWANERNSIEADENRLVVVQTPDVHQDIARLLQALQARRALLNQVEV